GQLRRRAEEQRASLVRGAPALVVRVEEPVAEELELELVELVLVEKLPHLAERPLLEHVLDVRVPEPDAPEPDAGGLLAAFPEVEQAPLPPEVDFDRSGRGPVEGDEVVHRVNLTPARDLGNNLGNGGG